MSLWYDLVRWWPAIDSDNKKTIKQIFIKIDFKNGMHNYIISIVKFFTTFASWVCCISYLLSLARNQPVGIKVFKVNSGNTRTMCKIFSKSTITTPELVRCRLGKTLFPNHLTITQCPYDCVWKLSKLSFSWIM